MSQIISFTDIEKKVAEARQDLFSYNIDAGIKKTIDLIGLLTRPAKENGKEAELNQIVIRLMTAMKQKDYLLFADIASYEIPALFKKQDEL